MNLPQPQSICFVAPRLHTNYEGWIEILTENGVSIDFLSIHGNPRESLVGIREARIKPSLLQLVKAVRRGEKNVSSYAQARTFLPSLIWLLKRFARYRPDLLIVRDRIVVSRLAYLANRIANPQGRNILYVQEHQDSPRYKSLIRALGDRILPVPEVTITPIWKGGTPDYADSSGRIVVPFAIPRRFSSSQKPEQSAHGSEAVVICAIGKYQAYKQLQNALLLFAQIDPTLQTHAQLHIIGQAENQADLDYYVDLKKQADLLGISSQTNFFLNLPRGELAEQLASADLLIQTNPQEVASITVLEAAVMGVAVLQHQSNGTSCYFRQSQSVIPDIRGEEGRLFLSRFIEEKSFRERMRQDAIDNAVANTSPERVRRRFSDAHEAASKLHNPDL